MENAFDLARSMTNYLKTAGVITKKQAADIHHQIDADQQARMQLLERSEAEYRERMGQRSWWRKLFGVYPKS